MAKLSLSDAEPLSRLKQLIKNDLNFLSNHPRSSGSSFLSLSVYVFSSVQRPTVKVTKDQGAVHGPGFVVIAKISKVMDIMRNKVFWSQVCQRKVTGKKLLPYCCQMIGQWCWNVVHSDVEWVYFGCGVMENGVSRKIEETDRTIGGSSEAPGKLTEADMSSKKESEDEMQKLESENQTLMLKERVSKQELQDAHKEAFETASQICGGYFAVDFVDGFVRLHDIRTPDLLICLFKEIS
ncbi:hypothetical protein LguiB_005234 [Lonicera macranthoides]